jgi:transcriptional regulator with XRE-family HTH domain
MTGLDLKEKLAATKIPFAEIARMMGIKSQDLNALFNVKDTKTGTLEKLSETLNVPIAYFFGDSYNVHGNNNALATGDHSTASSSDDRLLSLLMSKDTQLTMSMQQTSKAQEQITELIKMMQK